ncbi:hypothetical protein L218DRAFT_1022978 [Marasmius fiardii PR-910]|nr:hypothetical protein L218DRAFT_1022978 [Marasmius fiardii PR-910]
MLNDWLLQNGQSGECRMFIWTYTKPNRDGALQNHEMTHGLTNRMTGGGTGRCLQTLEAGGMGQGWYAVADWFAHSDGPEISDFNGTTNPLKYLDIGTLNEEHSVSPLFLAMANMLHNVYAQPVSAHGFSATARSSSSGTEGNVVFLQLLVDTLAIQPCNPTFPTARDAIIQADQNRFGGANKCLLWKVFASRDRGVYVDSMKVPEGC